MSQKKISAIVPVYNESDEVVTALLKWIVENSSSSVEWIIAAPEGDSVHRLGNGLLDKRSFVTCQKGRARQMNAGFHRASGELVLFLHADTRLGSGWLEELQLITEGDFEAAWGSFAPQIDAGGYIYRLAEKWGAWRTKTLGFPFGDQAIFISATLFRDIGCYEEQVDFMEELDLARRLKERQLSPQLLQSPAKTSGRQWQKNGALVYSTRNLILFFLFLSGVSRRQLKRFYK